MTDLSSTNGTYIDDEELVPLRAVEMSVGTEVTFGMSRQPAASKSQQMHIGFAFCLRGFCLFAFCLFAGDMFLAKFRLEERN